MIQYSVLVFYQVDSSHKKPVSKEENLNFLDGRLKIQVIKTRDVSEPDSPVEISLHNITLRQTKSLENSLNPEQFSLDVWHQSSSLVARLMDSEHVGAELVGSILISTEEILTMEEVEGWHDLVVGPHGRTQGQLQLRLKLSPEYGQENSGVNFAFQPDYNGNVSSSLTRHSESGLKERKSSRQVLRDI